MENAILLTPGELTRLKPQAARGYDIACVGSDFCQNLLPTVAEFSSVKKRLGLRPVLVTPLMTDAGLKRLEKLVPALLRACGPFETVVNDMGVLHFLHAGFAGRVKPVLGRLLTTDFLRMDAGFFDSFLRERGITLVETDEYGMLDALPPSIKADFALHHPFLLASVTRLCPYRRKLIPDVCSRPCEGHAMRLTNPKLREEYLLLKSCAYFLKQEARPHERVARLIYTPEKV